MLRDDASTYQVEFTINGLYDQAITNGHGSFHHLSFTKGGSWQALGDPSLPVISQLIAIPSGAMMSPSVTDEEWVDIDMPTIYPAQKLLREGETLKEFVINEQSYSQPFLPPLISMGDQMEWRGINNKPLAVCPFKYYPQNGKLSVLRHFVLRVDFLPSDEEPSRTQLQYKKNGHYGLFDNSVFTENVSRESNSSSENYEYLIFVKNSTIYNSNKLKEFRRWKALRGIKTKVILINSSWNSSNAIKDTIKNERNKGVRYVLFIGDDSSIEIKYVTSLVDSHKIIKSDYWYGCINNNNNYLEEIPIGRFPTSQLSEFTNMVDKTIRYEMGQNLSNKVLLVAHYDGANAPGSYQSCSNTILGQDSLNATFFTAYGAPINQGGDDATNSDVINQINQGMHIVNYRGHGGTDFWGGSDWGDTYWNVQNETFYASEVNNMSSNTNALFFSVSCNTGNITANSNMLETFMRSPKGASAFVGSTTSSYTYPNNTYDISLFEKLYNSDTCRLGDVNMNAHVYTIRNFSPGIQYNTNLAIDNAFSYICGGDPTLEIWKSDPIPVPDVNISSLGSSITVSTGINSGYYVCLSTLDGDFIDSTWVSSNTYTFTKPSDKFYFSIYKHDYIPFVVYCDSETDFLQNVTIADNRFYDNSPFSAGEAVDDSSSYGDVIMNSGSNLFIQKGSNGVLLDSGFKCNKGARLVIK